MFNLNENNQFFISNAPTDMRVGVNAMCGKVRQAGRNPTDRKVYVYVGKTRKVMKLLHWERGGYVMYYKRLKAGRLSPRLFPSDLHIGFREIRWDEQVLFIEGISPSSRRRKRFQLSGNNGENNGESKEETSPKVWLTSGIPPSQDAQGNGSCTPCVDSQQLGSCDGQQAVPPCTRA